MASVWYAALAQLSAADIVVAEGDAGSSQAVFTATLSTTSSQTVTVDYATAGGTASAGTDYIATSGTLWFAPGSTTETFAVTVLGDAADEDDETLSVLLSGAAGTTLADDTGIGTILDDDAAPTLSIRSARRREGNAGTRDALFLVRLSAPSGRTVTVDYTTANGSATAGSDYLATPGTLTFLEGSLAQTVRVPVVGDTAREGNETFFVDLTGASGASIAVPQARGTILDDDGVR